MCTNFIRDLDRKSCRGPYHAPLTGFWTTFWPNSMIFYNWHCFDKLHGSWFKFNNNGTAKVHDYGKGQNDWFKFEELRHHHERKWIFCLMLYKAVRNTKRYETKDTQLILQNGPMCPCHDVDDWWLTFLNHHFDILVHCTVIVVSLLVIKHYFDSSTLIIYKRNCWNLLKNEQLLSGPYPAYLFFDWQTVILCWLT